MKKIIFLSVLIMLISTVVSAQTPSDRLHRHRIQKGFSSGQITRPERSELRRDQLRYRVAQKRARRDGVVTTFERNRLFKMKRQNRQELFRFKHNNRRRVI